MRDEMIAIRFRLEEVASALNDLAMTILHEAIEAGGDGRPEDEKRVSQARRAVEKAIHHLAARGGDDGDD